MSNFERLNNPKETSEILEEMKRRICAGLGIPAEFIEPTLTNAASAMLKANQNDIKIKK